MTDSTRTNSTNSSTVVNSNPSARSYAATDVKAVFKVTQGTREHTFLVGKDRIVIGTVVSADVRIIGLKIAPIHAVIEIGFGPTPDTCSARLLDLASPGGTLVNGSKVIQQNLKPGDVIQIGNASLKFSFEVPNRKAAKNNQGLMLIDEQDIAPIFDYRPAVKEALEVVYAWNDTIIDVEHFIDLAGKGREVILGGTSEDDFLVPPVFSSGGVHTLASKTGNQWTVFIDSKMKGVIYIANELHTIEDYRNSKLSGNARGSVLLGENDFVKIEAGTVQFYLSQTTAPPVLKKNAHPFVTDPFFTKTLIFSALLTALSVVSIYKMDPQPAEVIQVPEVVATILYHPEKYTMKNFKKPEAPKEEVKKEAPQPDAKPKPKEIDFTKAVEKDAKVAQTKSPEPGKKQAGQNASKEGEGAKAMGAEGKRGSKNSKNTAKPQNAANRPSPDPGKDRGGTKSESQDNGNVQMIKGATNKITDLFGGSGEQLGKSGSKLQGFGGFSTQGNGGAGLQGTGKGGGGTADTLLGGLSDKGRGGGKVGTGLGAEGTGSGIVGGKTRIELRSGGGDETIVVGSIDRDAIDAAIRAHRDEFLYCYEREVNSGHPSLSGKIITAFVIGGSGRASQLAIAASSMNSPNVERCVLNVVSRIQFPQPAGGVPVTIKYPFNFSAQK